MNPSDPHAIDLSHLEPHTWARVQAQLIARALAELAHERLITPLLVRTAGQWGDYELASSAGDARYLFRAQRLPLDHWVIDAGSIRKALAGDEARLDARALFVELRAELGLTDAVLGPYLEELSNTLYAAAYKLAHERFDARQLAHADFQTVEAAMTQGHPCFIANASRLGFSARDYPAYAPEAGNPLRLVWLAVRREHALVGTVRNVDYDVLVAQQLGAAEHARLTRLIAAAGKRPAEYLLLPVHPWQWANKLWRMFASELASGAILHLGEGEQQYQPQQSIRTLYNVSQPGRCYIKTSLSILNMGFTRGMPASLALDGAQVNDWVADLVHGDPYLASTGLCVLREVAIVTVKQPHMEAAIRVRNHSEKELLGALFREPPETRLEQGERVMTMAALLHRDRHEDGVLAELVRASGLGADAWLCCYLNGFVRPLLHCFYRHRLVFTPHWENVLLVLQNHAPRRVIIKDIAEDVGVLNPVSPLPAAVQRLTLPVPEHVMTLSIFTEVFDIVLRFLCEAFHTQLDYPADRFWSAVAECVRGYAASQPDLAAELERYDLFSPRFARSCLNRLQLTDNRQMIDLNAPDPLQSLQFAGTLDNPIHFGATVGVAS